jgi:hypothetical protein
MFAKRSQPWRSGTWWALVSALLHSSLLLGLRGRMPEPANPDFFQLPDTVEFGVTDATLGPEGAAAAAAAAAAKTPVPPAPAPKSPPKVRAPKVHAPKPPAAATGAVTVSDDPAGPREDTDSPSNESAAAVSGLFGSAAGTGSGLTGTGPGGVGGGTIALNVDLERIRNSALLLETQALLDIIPEWQALLAGSGIDAVKDFRRVFVAAPSLDRAALIVSAEHALSTARINSAISTLAAERGSPAPFHTEYGVPVAAWHNRGPTERVIALTGDTQLLITRGSDLSRVLAVSRALGIARKGQGFATEEVEARGGLLAMQPEEAVALWVEGLHRYVRNGPGGIPDSLRLSIFRVDQFNTDLVIAGSYASKTAAEEALGIMDGLRTELSNHPRVIFLGLKSALDSAQIEQHGNMLRLKVRLTLHQTRYLMGFVKNILRPRAA